MGAYILVCLYLICVFVECNIHCPPPQHRTIHPNGMEVVANVLDTCDREAGQKLLLRGSHVHMDILLNHLKGLEKTGREMLKSRITSENPRQEEAEA